MKKSEIFMQWCSFTNMLRSAIKGILDIFRCDLFTVTQCEMISTMTVSPYLACGSVLSERQRKCYELVHEEIRTEPWMPCPCSKDHQMLKPIDTELLSAEEFLIFSSSYLFFINWRVLIVMMKGFHK